MTDRSARLYAKLRPHDDADAGYRSAKPDSATAGIDDRFDGVDWHPAPVTGSPILPGVVAWIDCAVEHVYDVGDHWFVVGRVEALEHADPWPNPMVFFRGQVGGYSSPPG